MKVDRPMLSTMTTTTKGPFPKGPRETDGVGPAMEVMDWHAKRTLSRSCHSCISHLS